MEDILASIRRILTEDDIKAGPDTADPPLPAPDPMQDDVLVLEPSMLLPEPKAMKEHLPKAMTEHQTPPIDAPATASESHSTADTPPQTFATLVAPEAAAAAAASVDTLVRTLSNDRAMRVSSNGATIEDIVRQEIRPMLKTWLDVNLPPLVERLVRTEIERVVGRAAS